MAETLEIDDGTLFIRTQTQMNQINSMLDYEDSENLEEIERIEIADGITSIPEGAFTRLYDVESVKFPETLSYIGSHAFDGVFDAFEIALPDKIEIIGDHAFANGDIEYLALPDNLKVIESGAFSECRGLDSVNIPASVEYVADGAFEACEELMIVYINNPETYIYASAFDPGIPDFIYGHIDSNHNLVQSTNDLYAQAMHDVDVAINALSEYDLDNNSWAQALACKLNYIKDLLSNNGKERFNSNQPEAIATLPKLEYEAKSLDNLINNCQPCFYDARDALLEFIKARSEEIVAQANPNKCPAPVLSGAVKATPTKVTEQTSNANAKKCEETLTTTKTS